MCIRDRYIVLPVHYQDAGLSSLWEVGIILSMNRLIRLPLNPLVGRLYRVISIRGGILLATLLAAVSTLGYALAESLAVWLLLRAVWGLSWTLLRIGGFFCILDVSDNSTRGYYMGLYLSLIHIFLSRTGLPSVPVLDEQGRRSALATWLDYARRQKVDLLVLPMLLDWQERQGGDMGAVSYTHLDVYKRQGQR